MTLKCGHTTDNGYVPAAAARKEGSGVVYWCDRCRRWRRAA